MVKKIIFYGGCHGINKSGILGHAIEKLSPALSRLINVIKISDEFEEELRYYRHTHDKDKPILWYHDDWKKYDKKITERLLEKTQEDKIHIINSHFSVLYKGKDNYVPGLELDSLKNLLIKSFCTSEGGVVSKIKPPCFGLLLIDPAPSLIVDYYTAKYKSEENNVLNYLSEQMILRDLAQNRIWAGSYYDTANAVLTHKNIHRETIYIPKELIQDDLSEVHNKIVGYLEKFAK